MPTPKFTPGAQLFPISLAGPAFHGLNTELAGTILAPTWATVLDNAVFDDSSRPAARKGFTSLTTTPGTEVVRRIFEYYQADGTSTVIYATDDDIFRDTTTATSIDGSLTITDGNIKFVNFNNKVIAFGIGASGVPAVRTTGNFASITVDSGTAPTGRIGTAAFGRLWGVDTDGKTIRYSALLDETKWDDTDGGGVIDMSQVWPSGMDSIVAIEEFGGSLVVFGSNNTVKWTDNQQGSLGMDPTEIYVSDTITGQGAISQFAIARVQGDLWVLTPTGIVSLQREFVQKSTPLTNISKNVQSEVISLVNNETDFDDITMEYSPTHAMVVAVFPASNKQLVFDVRTPLEDGAYRASTWTSDLQTITYIRGSRKLFGSLTGVVGEVMEYTGSSDDGASFAFDYESGWLDLGQELNTYLKFVKRLTSFVFVEQNVVTTHKVYYDFSNTAYTVQGPAGGGRVAEWGSFEWGDNGVYNINDANAVAGTDVAEWAGSVQLRTVDAPGKSGGQYIKVGLRLNTNSGNFALQQINLYAKIGRYAT